jgi:hypothetical protein
LIGLKDEKTEELMEDFLLQKIRKLLYNVNIIYELDINE